MPLSGTPEDQLDGADMTRENRKKVLSLGEYLDAEIRRVDAAILDVTRRSINDLVDDMTVPVAKGGRMPVDTGFLRKSGAGELNSWPSGPVKGDRKAAPGTYDDGTKPGSSLSTSLISALARMKIGDTLYYGWTAAYANAQETPRMFMAGAVLKWQDIVKRNVANVKRERGLG